MSVSTLAGTTWMFNDTINLEEAFEYEINFKEQYYGMAFTKIICENDWRGVLSLVYKAKSNGVKYTAYCKNDDSWAYENARNRVITISDGDDVENAGLIAFIEANAVQCDEVYKVTALEQLNTAVAIRKKSGTSSRIQFAYRTGFQTAINGIYVGNDTRDATASVWDIADGITAYSGGVKITGTMKIAEGVMF